MPELPVAASNGDGAPALPAATQAEDCAERSPYQQIAADLRAAIRCGALVAGDNVPTVKALADRYSVSEGTAHRAMAVLTAAGEVAVSRGRRGIVVDLSAVGDRVPLGQPAVAMAAKLVSRTARAGLPIELLPAGAGVGEQLFVLAARAKLAGWPRTLSCARPRGGSLRRTSGQPSVQRAQPGSTPT